MISAKNYTTSISHYRELLYFLVWKELKVRYKQAFFGILWTVLQPLIFAFIIMFIIGKRIGIDFGYENVSASTIMILSFTLWTFFESSFNASINSLAANESLMKKIFLPKAVLVLSPVISRLVDFVLGYSVFVAFLLFSGSDFSFYGFLWTIPVVTFLTVFNFSLGYLIAPLNLRFRDIKFIVPFLLRIMFFSTPIWYPFSKIPDELQNIFLLNPIVGAIQLTRKGFFDPTSITTNEILLPLIAVVVVSGLAYIFRKQHDKVTDYV